MGATYDGLEKPIPHGMDFISLGMKMLILSLQARYLDCLGRLIPNGNTDQQTDGQTNGPAV